MSQIPASAAPTIQLIATGGTIAMKVDPLAGGAVPALTGEDLLKSIPSLRGLAHIEVNNFSNLPSDHMDPNHWVALQQAVVKALVRDEIRGVVISHGTDTLEETAWFLDLTVASSKPVVLVGAQRNASELDFDGPRNLVAGARVCLSAQARDKGVLAVLNGQINAARDVTKSHTADVESFQSEPFGFLGVVDDDRVVFSRSPLRRQFLPLNESPLPRVDIVSMYAGADAVQLHAAIQAGANGLVIQALGLGNVNVALYEGISKAIGAGIPVVVSTRVARGRVRPVYGFDGGGVTLKHLGAVFADDLSPQKARILLMLAMHSNSTPASLQRLFDQ
jgi:L-asparaginase